MLPSVVDMYCHKKKLSKLICTGIFLLIVSFMLIAMYGTSSIVSTHLSRSLNFGSRQRGQRKSWIADVEVRDEPATAANSDLVIQAINNKIKQSESLHGTKLRNEYDVIQFTLFNRVNIYRLRPDLRKSPVLRLPYLKRQKRELLEVVEAAIEALNHGSERLKVSPTYRFTNEDFVHGLCRTEEGVGSQYEIVFKPRSSDNIINKHQLFRITLFRPFAPLHVIDEKRIEENETVYFIVPLKGRSETFGVFIDYFKQALLSDRNVHLTVVYHGESGLKNVKDTLQSLTKSTGFSSYNVISSLEEFSRGRALDRGINSITSHNPLLFFCDVDIAFTAEFLNQCRAHTSPGKSVFFPILFSLYNPSLIYQGGKIPSLRSRQVIEDTKGFWRDFGFGMSCQYLSEYKSIGGFDLSIKGWGTEDLFLYRKYSQSKFSIVRTPVNSLFHHWHVKKCDKRWTAEQYRSCIRSRIRTEGSVVQLGEQYFNLKEKVKKRRRA